MKLLCIDATPKHPNGKFAADFILKEGVVYTSIKFLQCQNDEWYELAEQIGIGYPTSHFVPTSDICETELAEQKEELVTVKN